MIGVILAVLAQGLYDMLKNTYTVFFPTLSVNFVYLLSTIFLTLILIGMWKIPVIIDQGKAGKPFMARSSRRDIGIGIGLLVIAIVISKFESSGLYISVIVIVLSLTGLLLGIKGFLSIGRKS
jgi:accessory gene regulator protein AgrB